jgi:hypothetical protein
MMARICQSLSGLEKKLGIAISSVESQISYKMRHGQIVQLAGSK